MTSYEEFKYYFEDFFENPEDSPSFSSIPRGSPQLHYVEDTIPHEEVLFRGISEEALPFYKQLEYSIEFTREGYDKNSKMFMLRKDL